MNVDDRNFVLAQFVSDCAGLAQDMGITDPGDLHDASCAVLTIGVVMHANPEIGDDVLEVFCAAEVGRQRALRELRSTALASGAEETLCQI